MIFIPKFPTCCYYQLGQAFPGMLKVPKMTNLLNLCSISRKNWGMKLFLMQIKTKVSYMLILSYLMDMARQVQSMQNEKYAISLPYLKKERHVDIIKLIP